MEENLEPPSELPDLNHSTSEESVSVEVPIESRVPVLVTRSGRVSKPHKRLSE